jgi:hypothetical protein
VSFSKQDFLDATRDNDGRGILKPKSTTLGTNNIQKVVKLRPLVHLFLSVATKLARRTPLKSEPVFSKLCSSETLQFAA